MRRKRLAILTPGYYEQAVGGAEYQSWLIAKAAKEAGLEVHHVYTQVPAPTPPGNTLAVNLHAVRKPRFAKYVRGAGNTSVLTVPQTYKRVKSIRPDVIYCRSGVVQAGIGAYYSKKFNHCKSIWQSASLRDLGKPRLISLMTRPLNVIEHWSIRYAITKSTQIWTQAPYQSQKLSDNYQRDSVVSPNLLPEPDGLPSKPARTTIVWIANHKDWKQPEKFVALAAEFEHRKDVQFIMIGRRSRFNSAQRMYDTIERLPNIQHLGELPMNEVNSMLAKAHLLVNTSLYEGFSNAFVQAWMRRVPVVSMLFDPDEILNENKIGVLSGSFEKMVQDVGRLIGDKISLREMGARAREYALRHHSYERNKSKLIELLLS